jgi:hypothetical protein
VTGPPRVPAFESQPDEIRASAGRITDILQQVVLTRPDLIIPLEDVVREFLETRKNAV